MIEDLRKYKFHLGDIKVAPFDFGLTILGGYAVAKYMNWNKPATIAGAFVVGHLAHNATGNITPLTARINDITTTNLPINERSESFNNSTEPVGVNETRFSTM